MTTAYYTADAICRAHDMGEGHPEQPGRLIAIEKGLDVVGIADRLDRRSAPPAADRAGILISRQSQAADTSERSTVDLDNLDSDQFVY